MLAVGISGVAMDHALNIFERDQVLRQLSLKRRFDLACVFTQLGWDVLHAPASIKFCFSFWGGLCRSKRVFLGALGLRLSIARRDRLQFGEVRWRTCFS